MASKPRLVRRTISKALQDRRNWLTRTGVDGYVLVRPHSGPPGPSFAAEVRAEVESMGYAPIVSRYTDPSGTAWIRVKLPRLSLRTTVADTTSGGIVLVHLERTACYGSCPVFTVAIEKPGIMRYYGDSWVPVVGHANSELPKGSVARLAKLIEAQGFWDLENNYHPEEMVTDLPARIVTVEARGRRKKVYDYGLSGPHALTRIEKAITGHVRRLAWGGRGPAND
jgi:hypothetical protein